MENKDHTAFITGTVKSSYLVTNEEEELELNIRQESPEDVDEFLDSTGENIHVEYKEGTKTIKVVAPKGLPNHIRKHFVNFTPLQRNYANYRSRGFTQAEAMKRAGSKSSDRENLARAGCIMEKDVYGLKEYIDWLKEERAKSAALTGQDLIDMLRRNYDTALSLGKIADANRAVELLGNMMGAFKPLTNTAAKDSKLDELKNKTKNNLDAFREDEVLMHRLKKLT